MSDERLKAILEFAGKFVLPVAALIAALIFKPTIENLPNTADSAEFLGVAIKFRSTPGFRGDLSPRALYYLIGSAVGGGFRYEADSATKPINELRDKGLVTINVKQITTGSREMQGTWADLTLTTSGQRFLEAMQKPAPLAGNRPQ